MDGTTIGKWTKHESETVFVENPCPISNASVFSSADTEKLFSEAEKIGFKYVLGIYEMVRPGEPNARVVVHNWPEAWIQAYRKHAYMSRDPVVFQLVTADRPFAWRDLPPPSPLQLEFMRHAASFGLVDGVSGPLHCRGTSYGVFTGASPTPLSSDVIEFGMRWLQSRLGEVFSDLRNQSFLPTVQSVAPLTLSIAKQYHQGMQAAAIADRQNITSWGVVYHLNQLRRKLGEKSNKAACAKAEALGLFCDVQGLLELPEQTHPHSNAGTQVRKSL